MIRRAIENISSCRMVRGLLRFGALAALCAACLVLVPRAVGAQPCCEITAINQQTGVVTAKINATGQFFEFKVINQALLKSLKVGQGVYANFKTHQVSVDGAEPCCNITSLGKLGGMSPGGIAAGQNFGAAANPGQPCCDITGINRLGPVDGIVTAKVNATGQTFQFKVSSASLLNSLKVGQAVFANFNMQKVSVDGAEQCCQIVTLAKGGGAGNTAFEQNLGSAVNPGAPCCSITGTDAARGVVTAKVRSTGQSFEFKVGDANLFHSLKVGQGIFANFNTQQVSVDGAEPCCQITRLNPLGPVDGAKPLGPADGFNFGSAANPAEPCCNITSINRVGPVDGIVTAKVNATGQTFQFKVSGASLLNSLKVGQSIFANFKTHQVSLDGKIACCDNVSFSGANAITNAAAPQAQGRGGGARPQLAGYREIDPCTVASADSLKALLQAGIQGYFPIAMDNGGEHIRITQPNVEQVICPHMVIKVRTDFGYSQTQGFPQFQTSGTMELQSSLVVEVTFAGGPALANAPITAANFVRAVAVLSNPQVTAVQIVNVPSWVDTAFVADCLNGKYSNWGCTDVLHAMSFDVTSLVKLYLDQGHTLAGGGSVSPPSTIPPRPGAISAGGKAARTAVITGIESQTGVVTAQDKATGRRLHFLLEKSGPAPSLSVGALIYVDLPRRSASLDGSRTIGTIVPPILARPTEIPLLMRFADAASGDFTKASALRSARPVSSPTVPAVRPSEIPMSDLINSGSYTFQKLVVPGADTLNGYDPPGAPYGINDSSQIVGSYLIADSRQLLGFRRIGFLEADKNFFPIDDSSAPEFTSAQGISAKQTIVGTYVDANFVFHGFIEDRPLQPNPAFGQNRGIRGNFTTIDVTDACQDFYSGTIPMGVNSRGDIVGSDTANPDCSLHGFLYSGGTFRRIDVPGASVTFPLTINDKGEIVGFYWTHQNPTQGFLYRDGTYTTISVPGSVRTWPQGINNQGQIIGAFTDASGLHCFLDSGKGFTHLDVPGAVGNTLCFDMNGPGQIVGVFAGSDGVPFGFVATPNQNREAATQSEPAGGSTLQAGPVVPTGVTSEACCGITSIDVAKNVALATEKSTGRSFQFKANSPAAMRSLKVGESIYANFHKMQVSLDGKNVFGTILSIGAASISTAGKQTTGVNVKLPPLPHAAFGPPQMIPATKAPVANPQAGGPRPYTRYSGTGGYTLVHLHGLAGIKGAIGVPQGVKDFLYLHARTLPRGQVDNYIVNTQLAEKWFQDHPEPDFVKQAAAQSSSGCSDNRCNTISLDCAKAFVQYNTCEADRYAQDVLRAARDEWDHITGQVAQLLGQAQACFQDQPLPVANGQVAFSIAPQFPLSFQQSGSTTNSFGKFSGNINGNATFGLPLDASFTAQLEMFYIPCLPFAVRPKSIDADGTLGLSATLNATLKANGQFEQSLTVPPTGGVKIPIEVFPITIDGVPVAEMDVSLYLEGSVNVNGNGSLDGAVNLQAHEETAFGFSCDGGGCNGQAHRVSVPDTATESVQVQGRIQLKPAVYAALQLDFDWDALSGRVGPEPYLLGEVYGCVAASGSQSTSGSSSSQEFRALTADVDWGIDLRREVLAGDQQLWHSNWPPIKAREHLLFKPLATSNALIPAIAGTTQPPIGQPAAYKVKMPACYPYTDQMEYQVQWTGGASPTGFASASNVSSSPNNLRQGFVESLAVLGNQGITFSPLASCTLQSGQADCLSDPLKDMPFNLTWPTSGNFNLVITPVRDKHGRIFDPSTSSQITISVQQTGTASSPSSQ